MSENFIPKDSVILSVLEAAKEPINEMNQKKRELVGQREALLSTLEPEGKILARENILARQIEEAIVNGKDEKAQNLKSQIDQIHENSDSIKMKVKAMDEEIERVRDERRKFVEALLLKVRPLIKAEFARKLGQCLDWLETEKNVCVAVEKEFQTFLPHSFYGGLRIYSEGNWRQLRNRFSEWIP